MNIDMIEIMENEIKFTIFPKKLQVLIHNKYYPIKEEKIKELIRITRTWDNKYTDSGYLDGNRFEISIHCDGEVNRKCGIRGVPNNYQEFDDWVRSIYDRG